jgi:hypothetical protein
VLFVAAAADELLHSFCRILWTELIVQASQDDYPPRGRSSHRRALDEDKPEKKRKEKGSKSKARASTPAPLLSQMVEVSYLHPLSDISV